MKREYEPVTITIGLLTMNAISTSKIISFIICSIRKVAKLNGVVIETTKYRSVTGQNRNGGFHIKRPKGDETRVSECDQLCGMCYQG